MLLTCSLLDSRILLDWSTHEADRLSHHHPGPTRAVVAAQCGADGVGHKRAPGCEKQLGAQGNTTGTASATAMPQQKGP